MVIAIPDAHHTAWRRATVRDPCGYPSERYRPSSLEPNLDAFRQATGGFSFPVLGLTKEKINEDLSVSAQTESNIVNVAATATSPALAAVFRCWVLSLRVTRFLVPREARRAPWKCCRRVRLRLFI